MFENNTPPTLKCLTRFSVSSVMWLPLTTVGAASNFRLYKERIIREVMQHDHMQSMLHSPSWTHFKVDFRSLQALQLLQVCASCLQELVIHCQNLPCRLLLQKQCNNTLPSFNLEAKVASEVLSVQLKKTKPKHQGCFCFVGHQVCVFSSPCF